MAETRVSVVSYWELMLKRGRPNALVSDPRGWWNRYIAGGGIDVIAIRSNHVDQLEDLPEWHRDPFDRMLVAQALAEGLSLVSKDEALAKYEVPLVWA